jgi:hypothetical protein
MTTATARRPSSPAMRGRCGGAEADRAAGEMSEGESSDWFGRLILNARGRLRALAALADVSFGEIGTVRV